MALLLLRDTGPLPPALRLLYWGTCAASAAVLALSFFARHRYATLRPHLLVTTRVVYNLLCPQLVWHLASQNMARNAERGSWPSEWMDCRWSGLGVQRGSALNRRCRHRAPASQRAVLLWHAEGSCG